jgi:hypothetical protein
MKEEFQAAQGNVPAAHEQHFAEKQRHQRQHRERLIRLPAQSCSAVQQ